jgi:hypothetical protein
MPNATDPPSDSPYIVPFPLGHAAGVDVASAVAAPLLAGGALALIGVVVQQEVSLRYPGVTLFLLVGAVVMLVSAVQCGIWARQYGIVPSDIYQWWPEPNEARMQAIVRDQRRHAERLQVWSRRVTVTFNVGILFLWLAMSVAVMPQRTSHESAFRWAAGGAAFCAAAAEVVIVMTVVQGPGGRVFRPLLRWLYGVPAKSHDDPGYSAEA